MIKKIVTIFLISVSGLSYTLTAQDYSVHNYGIREGLPTFFTKNLFQDPFGYIWIATDGGLTRFDGVHFETIDHGFSSNYIKDVALWSRDTLVVLGDEGIALFQLDIKLGNATYISSPDNAFFPRGFYKASDGTRWITYSNGVGKYENGEIIFFEVKQPEMFTGYGKMVFPFEHNNFIYFISQQGELYRYDPQINSIEEQFILSDDIGSIHDLITVDNTYFIASEKGLNVLSFTENDPQINLIEPLVGLTAIAYYYTENLVLATRSNGVYLYAYREKGLRKINNQTIQGINSVMSSDGRQVWVSSDQGITLLDQNLFQHIPFPGDYQYTQGFFPLSKKEVLVNIKDAIYRLTIKSNGEIDSEPIFSTGKSWFLSIAVDTNGVIYAGTTDGKIIIIDGNSVETVLVTGINNSYGMGIFNLFVDSKGDIWFPVSGNKGVFKMKSDRKIIHYDSIDVPILDIKETPNGTIYLTGDRSDAFFFVVRDNDILNLSEKLDLTDRNVSKLSGHQLSIANDTLIYLATDQGVFKYDGRNLAQLEGFQNFQNHMIRAIALTKEGNIWIGAESGLYQYLQGDFIEYSIVDGMPSVTVNYRMLSIDDDNGLWVGTNNGLSKLDSKVNLKQKSKTPIISRISIENKNLQLSDNYKAIEDEFIKLKVAPLTYPANSIQYLITTTDNSSSSKEIKDAGDISLTFNKKGKYTVGIQVITKGFLPSDPVIFAFNIHPQWYYSWYALILYLILFGVLLFFLFQYQQSLRNTKKTNLKLLDTERKLSLVVQNTPIILFGINKHGIFEFVVGKGLEKGTINATDFVGRSIYDVYSDSAIREKVKRALNGEPISYLRSINDIYLETRLSPVISESGKVSEVIGVSVDITDRILVENELINAKEKAVAANQAKSTFLANMSHELRTPLNAILGFSQLLQKQKDLTGNQIKYINTIYVSGEHLLNMINEILDLSKIESGKIEIKSEVVNVRDLIEELESMFHAYAIEKNIKFHFTIEKAVPISIITDRKRLKQIIINLIGNAIKFTNKGGVQIEVRVSGKGDNETIHFNVRDSGKGIDPDKLDEIFEPFKQEKENYSTGTGLGLSIVKNLTELLGGSVDVESTLGVGSVFSINLPVTKPLDNHNATKVISEKKSVQFKVKENTTVWIADDKEENRILLQEYLKQFNFIVESFENGSEISEYAKNGGNPALIILDIYMPVMDGRDALLSIKKTFEIQNREMPPVIAVTAGNFNDLQGDLFALGFDQLIQKPFKDQKMRSVIYECLKDSTDMIKELGLTDTSLSETELLTKIKEELNSFPESVKKSFLDKIEILDLDELIQFFDKSPFSDLVSNEIITRLNDKEYRFLISLSESIN